MRREVKMLWVLVWFYALLNCGLTVFISNQHQKEKDELVKFNKELMQMLVEKDAKIQIAKNDLNEAHEIITAVFVEAMSVTDKYNELKKIKQTCKAKK